MAAEASGCTADERLQARLGPGDTTVETPEGPSLRLDAEGRWGSFRPHDDLFRRTLDGKVVVHEGAELRVLENDEAERVHAEAIGFAAELAARVAREQTEIELHGHGAERAALCARLEVGAAWSVERYRGERTRYDAAYPEPMFILPPDRYQDVVVLPAVGCPHGRCKFCAFYRERGFRILEPAEFDAHLEAVRDFYGRARLGRNGVFLGSASALSLPDRWLVEVLAKIRAAFGEVARGVAAFEDPDHAPRRAADDYAALRAAGLRAVTVGLETGWPALREELGKRRELDRVLAAVAAEKEAGLTCGVTVLVGAGGRAAAADHRAATADAVAAMALDKRDMVYLSPLAEGLPGPELAAEYARFREALAQRTMAKLVPYRIERFFLFG